MNELNLENNIYISDLQHNYISMQMLNNSRYCVIFENDRMVNINDVDNNSITKIGHAIGDLFHLSTDEAYLANANGANGTFNEYALWHHRLGHPGQKVIRSMIQYATGLRNVQLTNPINDVYPGYTRTKSY